MPGHSPEFIIPRSGPRDTKFSFDDKAFRIAAATRQEHFDLLGAYSYRSRGNYFSGKGGSQRYETESWLDQARADALKISGSVNTAYLAQIFLPGHEVGNSSSEIETTLLKGTLYLPKEQKLKLNVMHTNQRFGEAVPYFIYELMRLETNDARFVRQGAENVGLQYPLSRVKQKSYNLTYAWKPDHPLVDFQASLWATKSDAQRHQNGDSVFGMLEADWAWDRYLMCKTDGTCSSGDPVTQPERQPNTNGRYNVRYKALQISAHNRWGVNLSNRFQLHPKLDLTLAGDFTREKLAQRDAYRGSTSNILTWGAQHMGPRGGKREQYNLAFNFDWAATSWLQLSAGARYSHYWSFDTDLDRHRRNRDDGWQARAHPIGMRMDRVERTPMTASEYKALEGKFREGYQTGLKESAGYFTQQEFEAIFGTEDEFVAKKYRMQPPYTEQEVIVPFDGAKIDPSRNPFLNGATVNDTITLFDGRVVPKYGRIYGQQTIVLSEEPKDPWKRPEKRKGHAWAPMFGATVFLTDYARIYARYSEFVRFPSIYEDTQAAFGYGYGNVYMNHMRPERSANWEVGSVHDLTQFFPDLRHADIKINYYNNQIRDYVDRNYDYQIIQYARKKLSGIELQARIDTGRHFASVGATYRLKNKLCDSDYAATLDPFHNKAAPSCITAGYPTSFARTSLQPQYSINLDAGLRLLDDKLQIGGRMVYHASARNKDEADMIRNGLFNADSLISQPYNWQPIWVFDAYASYNVNDHLTIDAGVNNITNRYYLDPMARTLMPAPGRTMKLALTARF